MEPPLLSCLCKTPLSLEVWCRPYYLSPYYRSLPDPNLHRTTIEGPPFLVSNPPLFSLPFFLQSAFPPTASRPKVSGRTDSVVPLVSSRSALDRLSVSECVLVSRVFVSITVGSSPRETRGDTLYGPRSAVRTLDEG